MCEGERERDSPTHIYISFSDEWYYIYFSAKYVWKIRDRDNF